MPRLNPISILKDWSRKEKIKKALLWTIQNRLKPGAAGLRIPEVSARDEVWVRALIELTKSHGHVFEIMHFGDTITICRKAALGTIPQHELDHMRRTDALFGARELDALGDVAKLPRPGIDPNE